MAGSNTIRRYLHIIKTVRQSPGITKIALISLLNNEYGCKASARTFERDLSELRISFDIEISYETDLKGYVLKNSDNLETSSLLLLMNKQQELELLESTLIKARSNIPYIVFEPYLVEQPHSLIMALLDYIHSRTVVTILYTSYLNGTQKEHEVEPHILHQSWGRWFLLAWSRRAKNWISFALDRIESHIAQQKNFQRRSQENIDSVLSDNFGAFKGKPELVKIRVTPLAAQYIESLPIHISQERVSVDKEEHIFSLYLSITPDFEAKILSFGDSLEVLSPSSLRDAIKKRIMNMSKNYKNL